MKFNFNIDTPVIRFEHIYEQRIMVEEVRKLFLEYMKSLKINLYFQDFETEIKILPGKYGPPYGTLILALIDDKATGTITLRKISENTCEMKRLYVRDTYRKLGIGKKLVSIIL